MSVESIIIVILGALLLLVACRDIWLELKFMEFTKSTARVITGLHKDLHSANHAYEMLEKGADEAQESFEAEWLTFDEKIKELTPIVEKHNRYCLPHLADIREKAVAQRAELHALRDRILSRG